MMTSSSRFAIVSSSCLRPLHPKQPSRLVVIPAQAAKRCKDSLVTKIVMCGCVDCDVSQSTHPHCLINIFYAKNTYKIHLPAMWRRTEQVGGQMSRLRGMEHHGGNARLPHPTELATTA